jgi:hypothetical protein
MSERPCPTCREPVQREMLFERSAFEPTDADLDDSGDSSPIEVDNDDDDGLPIAADLFPTKKKPKPSAKGKGKAKKFTKRVLDSDEDYEDADDSDLSDFILESDEDEDEKDARRELKKKLSKSKRVVLDSDEDVQMEDEDELIPPTVVAKKKGKTVHHFLPSTKMKVCRWFLLSLHERLVSFMILQEMMVLIKEWAETEESRNEKVCGVLSLHTVDVVLIRT